MKKLIKIIIIFAGIIGSFSAVSGSVSDFNFDPDEPVIGDSLVIKGTATSNEVIKPSITLNTILDVKGNKYKLAIDGLDVPTKKNTFEIKAEHVKDLNVKVVKWGLSWTLRKNAVNGIASLSQGNVPDWKYNIQISGTADTGITVIPLTVTATTTSSEIKADEKGNFKFEYSTAKLLPGTYVLTIGGITKEIKLLSKKEKSDQEKAEESSKDENEIRPHITGRPETKGSVVEAKETPSISETEGSVVETKETPSISETEETSNAMEPDKKDSKNIFKNIFEWFDFWN